ncbi:MAG TPA: DUF2203 domain-containing protein [Patescibacteria group bacterium]|nr:DUF2203 domain-containing protein [Patescibacteria group bacterium]
MTEVPAQYFTVEEANAILPEIDVLMDRLQFHRSRMIKLRREIVQLLELKESDIGGSVASSLVSDFIAIERLMNQIRSHGCLIKDLNTGLVDFLSKRDGREVYLCWRYGEPRIDFYHELHTGFKNRQQI